MSYGYLLTTTEYYRFDSEDEAKEFVERKHNNSAYEVKHYSIKKKERKSKGEVIDTWYTLSITMEFNDEKEPDNGVDILYSRGGRNFED